MFYLINPFRAFTLSMVNEAQAREYNRLTRKVTVIDTIVGFLVLSLLLFTGLTTTFRDKSLNLAGGGYTLGVFFYVVMLMLLLKLAGFAIELYGYRLEHRFHLSEQKLGAWLWDSTKEWLVGTVFAVLGAETVYYIIRQSGEYWWIWAWLIFALFFIILNQLGPVLLLPLFYKFQPLGDVDLRERLERMSQKVGMRVRGIYEWKLSEKSKKANAALTGLGVTRRILLADNLLNHYTHDEIEAVLAHELGHHVHKHIQWGIVVQSAVSLFGFFVAAQVLEYAVRLNSILRGKFSDLHDFADLPVLLLTAGIVGIILTPALNAYSRRNERQADDFCWRNIPSVQPFVSAMEKLEEQNLAERNPAPWVEMLFHSHPSLGRRLAAAQAFASSKK